MSLWYRLDEFRNVIAGTSRDYNLGDVRRRVARTEIPEADCEVSTVFVGLDMGGGVVPAPLVFETMVFGGELNGEQERYCTWDEAEAGHARWVQRCRDLAPEPPASEPLPRKPLPRRGIKL